MILKCILFPSFCGASNGQGGGIPSSYLALAQHRCEWHTWCAHIFFLLYYLLSIRTEAHATRRGVPLLRFQQNVGDIPSSSTVQANWVWGGFALLTSFRSLRGTLSSTPHFDANGEGLNPPRFILTHFRHEKEGATPLSSSTGHFEWASKVHPQYFLFYWHIHY